MSLELGLFLVSSTTTTANYNLQGKKKTKKEGIKERRNPGLQWVRGVKGEEIMDKGEKKSRELRGEREKGIKNIFFGLHLMSSKVVYT